MANAAKELEEKFLELGESLASPPASVNELYSLLELIDGFLSRVEQSPSQSMLDALQPLMKALSVEELLRHSDMDVKAAVASCISEITRITAPEAPYDDDIMKEVFKMIVGSFEALDDMSIRSFQKRVSILETVAKVRSCVVMLDLECDALILQMFHHFLKTIRTDHSVNVFTSMETIMTLVIEESEDISSDLLSCLLDTLKNDNEDVLPIAQKLAEKVIGACANKIKPYLVELVQSTGAPLSKYSKVVASICEENSDALDQNETHASGEVMADDSKLSDLTVSDGLPQVSAKLEQEVGSPEKVGTAADISPIEATSNCAIQLGNGDSMGQPSSPKQKSERSRRKNVVSERADGDNLESTAVKPDGTTDLKKAKGRKTNSSVQLADTTEDSRIDSDKDAPMVTNRRKGRPKEADNSQVDDISAKKVESAVSLEPEKTNDLQHLSEPGFSSEPENKNELQRLSGSENPTSVASPTPNESPLNSARTKRGRLPGSKAAAKHSDVDAVAEPPTSASVQKDPSGNSQTHDEPIEDDESKKEPEDAGDGEAPASVTSDSKVKPRNAGKRGRFKRKAAEQESSGRKHKSYAKQQKEEDTLGDNTKQQKEGDTLGKDVGEDPSLKEMASSRRSALKAPGVDQIHLDDSVKRKSRRKRPMDTEDISETPDHKKELDEHLVGSKIKVWWPVDKAFYDGVVNSYDPDTKKHKIVYADGDIEVLLLKDERWEYVESDLEKNGGKQKGEGSGSQMSRSKKGKSSLNAMLKQAKSRAQAKSGIESSSKDSPRPRGRPRSGTSNLGKLSYDDTPGTSKKSKRRTASDDKAKTLISSGKGPEIEPEDKTPRTSSEPGNKSKDMSSKSSKSGRKSKNETAKSSTKSGDDTGKSDSTPKTANRSEVDEVGKNKTLRGKPKTINIPKTGADSKENGLSSKGKTKVGKSENTPHASDGEATTIGRKRKRKGRK